MEFDFLLLHCRWARVFQVRLDIEDVRVANAFVDQLEKDRPKISIRSLLQFAPVRSSYCHIHRVNRELGVGCFIDTTEDLNCPHQSSALGTVCFPRTSPPKKPTRCSSEEESLRGHNEKVATPTATSGVFR